jgi:tetratricopeptide repeat protein
MGMIAVAVKAAAGRYADAEPLFKSGLAIRAKAQGPDHRDVAASLDNLAALHNIQGHYVDAESLYKSSLGILEGCWAPTILMSPRR